MQFAVEPAEFDEVFTLGRNPFNLAAPAAGVGDPVPPPYVTLIVRFLDTDKTTTLASESRRIQIPQIVQVRWEGAAETLFRTPQEHERNGQTTLVYAADYTGNSEALMQDTLQRLQAFFPPSVNILFVPFYSTNVETTKFLFITPDLRKDTDALNRTVVYTFGLAPPNESVQRSATGVALLHLGSIIDRTETYFEEFAESDGTVPPSFPVPVTSAQVLRAICRISTHEVGHTLGLVDTHHLDGMGRWHNPGGDDQSQIMNVSTDLRWLFSSSQSVGWRTLNQLYLEFVLTVPD